MITVALYRKDTYYTVYKYNTVNIFISLLNHNSGHMFYPIRTK